MIVGGIVGLRLTSYIPRCITHKTINSLSPFTRNCLEFRRTWIRQRAVSTMAHNLPNLVKPTHYNITLYNFDLEKFTFSGDVTIRYPSLGDMLIVVLRSCLSSRIKLFLIRMN